jgi:putative flippase GtrA
MKVDRFGMPVRYAEEARRLARFIAVGVLNTLVGYGLIFGLMLLAGWSPELSNITGYALGLVVAYLLHRSVTFKSENKRGSEFGRFLLVFAIAFSANFVTLWVLLHAFGLADWAAQIFAGVVYVGSSYVLNRSFVFGAVDKGTSEPARH